MALRCRERAPSTTSKPASRAAKKIGRPPPQGQTYSPNFDRLSMKRLGGMTDAAAGVHRRAREHGGVAARSARAAGRPRAGALVRSYSNDVSPDRRTLRTVLRDTPRSRAISLIVLPLTKCSRRIRAIVSTTSIPDHPLESKREACDSHTSGGQFWTPIPQLRGSILHAE